MSINNYIESNKDRFLSELFDILRIPSISADSAYAGDVRKCAEKVAEFMTAAGAENVVLEETSGNPIVYGEKIIDPSLPTVLVYGHYDVQPSVPNELWNTPPFEPTIIDNKKNAAFCFPKLRPFIKKLVIATGTANSMINIAASNLIIDAIAIEKRPTNLRLLLKIQISPAIA